MVQRANLFIFIVFFMTAMALSRPVFATTCKTYFAPDSARPTPQGQNANGIWGDSVPSWTTSQWFSALRIPLRYVARSTQTLFELKDFSKEEQNLIQILQQKSEDLKYRRRSPETNRSTIPNHVEFGALRITLANGKTLTALFTSKNSENINTYTFKDPRTGEAYEMAPHALALDAFFDYKQLDIKKIISIQYFHTHSDSRPLSLEDIQLAQGFKNDLLSYGVEARVNIYAIVKPAHVNQNLIFQHGL